MTVANHTSNNPVSPHNPGSGDSTSLISFAVETVQVPGTIVNCKSPLGGPLPAVNRSPFVFGQSHIQLDITVNGSIPAGESNHPTARIVHSVGNPDTSDVAAVA